MNPEKVQGSATRPPIKSDTDFPWLPMMLPKSQPGSIHWHNFPDTLHPPDSLIANRVAADVKISDGPVDAQGIGQRCTRWLVAKQQQKAFHLHWKTDLRQETRCAICFCTNGVMEFHEAYAKLEVACDAWIHESSAGRSAYISSRSWPMQCASTRPSYVLTSAATRLATRRSGGWGVVREWMALKNRYEERNDVFFCQWSLINQKDTNPTLEATCDAWTSCVQICTDYMVMDMVSPCVSCIPRKSLQFRPSIKHCGSTLYMSNFQSSPQT